MTDQDQRSQLNEPLPILRLELNANAIIGHAQNAVVLCSEIVDFTFEAMDKADLSKKPFSENTQYKFKSPEISAADRRALFENWIFSRAFQDLIRGIRASLEQGYFFLELLAGPRKVKSDATFEEFCEPLKRKAATLNFRDLLDQVNSRLPSHLTLWTPIVRFRLLAIVSNTETELSGASMLLQGES